MLEPIYKMIQRIRLVDVLGACVLLVVAVLLVGVQRHRATELARSLEAVGARAHRDHANRIYHVSINDKRIVGKTLANVAQISSLEQLSLSRSTLGSGQAKHLANMNCLRTLTLYDTNISSYELGYVGQCRNLEVLSLDGTPVGNAGLGALTKLRSLRYLSLARTEIGNSAYDALAKLERLEELDLRGTSVTQDTIARLREALPECRITTDPPQHPTGIALRRKARRHHLSM